MQLFVDMCGCESKTVVIHVDNQGAIALAKNPVHHQRSKHIDIKYHFIRLQVQEGVVEFQYIPTEDNVADMFTKPISMKKMRYFMTLINS